MATRRGGAVRPDRSAATQLGTFIAKFNAGDRALIRSVRAAVRKKLPTAHELVYDNYNFFVIGYGPNERASDAVVSIAARAVPSCRTRKEPLARLL